MNYRRPLTFPSLQRAQKVKAAGFWFPAAFAFFETRRPLTA
jgi:hypothetical protein